jgi:predicted Zn finger-like uncharacterized protein
MLLTRCPDCDTTFRVTDETLRKANGQVRCGRCASVFNAYAELQDPGAKSFEAPPPSSVVTTPRRAEPTGAEPTAVASVTGPTAADAVSTATPVSAADSIADRTIGDVVAEAAIAQTDKSEADDEASPLAEDFEAISAHQVDEVLGSTVSATPADGPEAWSAFDVKPERKPASRWWSAAAALAVVTLAAQAVHHFRADVAGHPTFGPFIQSVYAALGTELEPRWDVRQYEILDWVATAEPNARGLGSLKITARIQNRGPLRDKAVSSRMFTPAEYLSRESPRERLMAPGETTRAEMEVVDPGPDAYGFELDVCIEVEASLVTCGTDEVFL